MTTNNESEDQNTEAGTDEPEADGPEADGPEANQPETEGSEGPAMVAGDLSSVEEGVSGRDASEVEWRFDAGELAPIEGWLAEHFAVPGLTLGSGESKNLSDAYYDTGGWVFYRAGYALRIRHRGKSVEATLESLTRAPGGVQRRRAISEALDDGELATLRKSSGKVGERVRALAGDEELHRLFEIRTHRRAYPLRLDVPAGEPGSGVVVGEVSLDRSEVPLEAGEEPAHALRAEVQALEELLDALRPAVHQMKSALDLSPTPISKYQVGLYATGIIPDTGTELGPTEVHDSLSAGEVAYAVLRRQLAAFRRHEPGARLGEDPEELHDLRVASRRMRSAIKLFSDALPERALWLEGELRWLAGALGEVRDLDVQVDQLRAWSTNDPGDKEAFESMAGAVEEQRARAREQMLAALDSSRHKRLVSSLTAMLRRDPIRGPETGAEAESPITEEAPDLLAKRYRKFREAADQFAETSRPEDYHELRKKGKRLRYALEFLTEVYGKPVKKLVQPLKSLQDDLGRHQDAVVAADRLREISTSEEHDLSRETVYIMGSYAERYRREAAELRASLPGSKAFQRLTSPETQRELEKSLNKRRP